MEKLLVLGRGYVGRALEAARQDKYEIRSTSRSDAEQIHFDLLEEKTWDNLPQSEACIWTFPAVPLEYVMKFYKSCGKKLGKVIVIGTTGSFQVSNSHEIIDENFNLDPKSERVAGEQYLLSQGANIVYSAGIYGEGRDPRDWVMRGLVGPDERYVNFIHVDDLCQIVLRAIESGSSKSFIAADGNPQKWSDLIEMWKKQYNLVLPARHKKSQRQSKRLDPTESLKALNIELIHSSVNEGLWPIGS